MFENSSLRISRKYPFPWGQACAREGARLIQAGPPTGTAPPRAAASFRAQTQGRTV